MPPKRKQGKKRPRAEEKAPAAKLPASWKKKKGPATASSQAPPEKDKQKEKSVSPSPSPPAVPLSQAPSSSSSSHSLGIGAARAKEMLLNPCSLSPTLSTDNLVNRLKLVATELQGYKQQEKDDDYSHLLPFALHLVTEPFFTHASSDVRILVACCLADILRVLAPEAPFTETEQIQSVFKFLTEQLSGLANAAHPSFKRYFYLLDNLRVVRSFLLCLELDSEEDAQTIFIEVFETVFKTIR